MNDRQRFMGRKRTEEHAPIIRCHGMGLVAGLHMVKKDTKEPDGDLAWEIVRRSVEKGLLLFSPVGYGGATVKISPPLNISEEAVVEGVYVLEGCIAGATQ